MNFEILRIEMHCLALQMDQDSLETISPGTLISDERFEIVSSQTPVVQPFVKLPPPADSFIMKPVPYVTAEIERKTRSLNFMLIGESAVLILIVIVSLLFLYRYIQLERKTTQAVHEFWARSAHQIKTPITGVKSFMQNLKNRAFSDDELDNYINMALSHVDKQERLAENILSGHLLITGPSESQNSCLELKPFLQKYFTHALHLSDIELQVDWDQFEKIKVRGNEESLKVVLDNITDNAVKYCSPDLILKLIIIGHPKHIHLGVCDNGPGFSGEQLPLIFEAYKNMEGSLPTQSRGSGIGLYLSRRLMRKMGGDLKAESRGPNEGACFFVILPKSS
jgi:signal transduction histidine kinase